MPKKTAPMDAMHEVTQTCLKLVGKKILGIGMLDQSKLSPNEQVEGGFVVDYEDGKNISRLILGFTELGSWIDWEGVVFGNPPLPSDEAIMSALPEIEGIYHIGPLQQARFYSTGFVRIISKVGRPEADAYEEAFECIVPTMPINWLPENIYPVLREAMKPVSKHGKVIVLIRETTPVEFGFLTSKGQVTLQRSNS